MLSKSWESVRWLAIAGVASCAPATGPATDLSAPAPVVEAISPADRNGAGPIIDMHLHAEDPSTYGPPGKKFCMEMLKYVPPHDPVQDGPWPQVSGAWQRDPGCPNPLLPAADGEALMNETLAVMVRLDMVGVVSGAPDTTARWQAAAPDRIVRGRGFNLGPNTYVSPADLGAEFESGQFAVLAEVTNQYHGFAPNAPEMEPFWQLAEERDIPVGIHIGAMPPGMPYMMKKARYALGDPLLLEEVLIRHPRLRVFIMHAGSPMVERTIALMHGYPQVYADTGVLQSTLSHEAYYDLVRRMVDAGLGKRLMYGTDQMIWPGMIEPSVQLLRDAPFLSHDQKRDILYNNAARFLRRDALPEGR